MCLAVFGSVARNTQTFQSDIDVLIIVSGLPDGRMNRMDRFNTIEAELLPALQKVRENGWNVELSPVIRTPEEVRAGGYFYLDMVDDALILYDKDNFFANYLQELKKRLNEYGAQKKRKQESRPCSCLWKKKIIQMLSVKRRKEREFSFYGDIDLIPTEEYTESDAKRAMKDTRYVLEWARPAFL